MACSFAAERSFGPAVAPCRRSFDFTLLFEEIVFQIIPSSLFMICAAARLFRLVKRRTDVKLGVLHAFKLGAATVFSILELAVLLKICIESNDITPTSVPSAVLSFIAAVSLIVVSHYEHTKSCRPSFLIVLYLCVTALLRAATIRTYWSLQGKVAIASITLSALAVQIVMIVLESSSKRQYLVNRNRKISSEEMAGFLSRSLFAWLNRLMLTGYQRALTPSDIQSIDKVLYATRLRKRFERLLKSLQLGRTGFPGVTLECLQLYLVAPIIPRLCLTGFTFSQPFFVSSLLAYMADGRSASQNDGYGLIGACVLVYGGIAISSAWYWHMTFKSITMIRGGLVDAIFEKMLKLKEDKDIESRALTLMISDVQRIVGGLSQMHEMWAALLETALATWLLWNRVGPSSLAVLALALACTVVSTFIGKHSGSQQQVWLQATQKRIAATKKMLSSLKAIKMTGSDQRAGMRIEELRTKEFQASKTFRTLLVGSVLSSYTTLTLSPVMVFVAYIGATQSKNADLDASRLFTSLILITLLASPLIRILQTIPILGAAKGCFERVHAFIVIPERLDYRLIHSSKLGSNASVPINRDPLKNNIDSINLEELTGSGTDSFISVRNADFGWGPKAHLRNMNLDVQKGEHIAITGPVGCGKSLLLKGILGETELMSGTVSLGTANIGYCGQESWLENLTALENAFRCAPEDNGWHQAVIDACALDSLLHLQSDSETVGSGGAKISGGEKQRLALARTIAFRPDIILLDDVFSAIDRTTGNRILDRLFGPHGILRQLGTTVILTVQDKHWATMADKFFEMDEHGQLNRCGLDNLGPIDQDDSIEATTEPPSKPFMKTTKTDKNESSKRDQASTDITDRSVYKTYFSSIGFSNMVLFFIGGIAFAFCLKFPDIWVQWWSNASVRRSSRSTGYWVGIYALLEILPLVMLCLWIGHMLLRMVPTSGLGLHRRLLKVVLNAPFVFISGVDTGNLMNRFNQDLMLVDSRLPMDLFNSAAAFFTSIIQIVLVTVAAVYVLTILPILFIVLYLIQHFYLRTSKQLRFLDLQSKSGLHTKFSETHAGLVTIRAHGWQDMMRREFEEKLDRSQEPLYLLYLVQRWLQLVLNLVVAGLSIVVVGVAVGTRNKVSAGAIGVAFLNTTTLGETLTNLIASWTSLETSLGAIARIISFEKETPIEPEIESPIQQVSAEWPTNGSIRFNDVWTSYNPDSKNPNWSLRGINLEIQPGEKIAICGLSGSGKSTFLLSLLGLLRPTKGSIIIDDTNISQISKSTLQSRFHVISQDTFTQQGDTVRESLDPEGRLDDVVILNMLRDCGILEKIHAFGGLEGRLDDANFSAGEAQLFSLVRTFLAIEIGVGGCFGGGCDGGGGKKREVVLFDEATSSVDTVTEKRIMRLIDEKLKGKTVISVLHRLETAMEYDRILVLEGGRIVCFGSVEEVVRVCDLFGEFRGGANAAGSGGDGGGGRMVSKKEGSEGVRL